MHAVPHATDGAGEIKNARIALRRAASVHTARAAAEDQPVGLQHAQLAERDIRPHKLAEDALLAHASCDELGVLRAEVQNRDNLVVWAGRGGFDVIHRAYLP